MQHVKADIFTDIKMLIIFKLASISLKKENLQFTEFQSPTKPEGHFRFSFGNWAFQ